VARRANKRVEQPVDIHVDYKGFLRHFICYPNCQFKLCWDAIGAAMIFYDLFIIPLLQAFNPSQNLFLMVMDWLTLIYWTLSMGGSVLVGYVHDGRIVLDPKMIFVRYLKTWFIIDVLVVVPDWAFTIFASTAAVEQNAKSVKLLRFLRLIRMTRLLRLLKLRKIFDSLSDFIVSEYVSIFANIAKMIIVLLAINHFIGCIWFVVGSAFEDAEDTWIKAHGFDGKDWVYQYATAFHWSITQFTPASMHVQPQNRIERFFAITVVVFGLVGFSYLVGSITGSLTQIRSLHEDASKQFWDLRRYLKQNQIGTTLSIRIQKYLEHAWQNQRTSISIGSIKLLKLLSEQLFAELQSELFVPHLSIHPLFLHLNTVSPITIHRLANAALGRKWLARDDLLFIAGESPTHMYVVASGQLEYSRVDSQSKPHREIVDKSEDWISEPVLWTAAWIHIGGLAAITESDLVLVAPGPFGKMIRMNPVACSLAITYLKNFMNWLNSVPPDDHSDISQGENVTQMVYGFMEVPIVQTEVKEVQRLTTRRTLMKQLSKLTK